MHKQCVYVPARLYQEHGYARLGNNIITIDTLAEFHTHTHTRCMYTCSEYTPPHNEDLYTLSEISALDAHCQPVAAETLLSSFF